MGWPWSVPRAASVAASIIGGKSAMVGGRRRKAARVVRYGLRAPGVFGKTAAGNLELTRHPSYVDIGRLVEVGECRAGILQ